MQQFYLLMISMGWWMLFHPFHLSLTEINWNPESEKLEISQKIFWDDLEISLSEYHDKSIDFLNPTNKEILTKQVESYLLAHNQIWINGKATKFSLLGYEVEEDAAWFYIESEKVPKPLTVKVSNTVLFDNFPDQKNVAQFFFEPHQPKSVILTKGSPSGTLQNK